MFIEHTLIQNKKLNDKFILLTFKSLSSQFTFKEGQFVTIKIADTIFRCYSIISSPNELPNWKMFVDITPGGPGTTYLKKLKKGEIIKTLEPRGALLMDIKPSRFIFGATGCGLAPFLSMLLPLNLKNKEIYLYWGLRNREDIVFENLFKTYSKKYLNFHYEISLSNPDKKWRGLKGHVNNFILEKSKESDAKNTAVYLSGSGQFVDDVGDNLQKNKFRLKNIHHEACY